MYMFYSYRSLSGWTGLWPASPPAAERSYFSTLGADMAADTVRDKLLVEPDVWFGTVLLTRKCPGKHGAGSPPLLL